MKGFADELAATGKPVGEDELISFILAGLHMDNSITLVKSFTPLTRDRVPAVKNRSDSVERAQSNSATGRTWHTRASSERFALGGCNSEKASIGVSGGVQFRYLYT